MLENMDEIYARLARFLDDLPAGYPSTESGVELRILRKLFTPAEAELFMHLNLIPETAELAAYRAGLPVATTAARLEEMERKGLVFGLHRPDQPPAYMAQQFVVGFWEGQVNRLDRELVEDFEAYLPALVDLNVWQQAPQLRTIPIGEAIPIESGALPYERAEELVRAQTDIAVAPCICRQEMALLDEACDKPSETCLSFGASARYFIHTGKGRPITQPEALRILALADQAGLVLQPSNAEDPLAICACCGCCCGVLRSLKRHPRPAEIAASPYIARHDPALCSGCGDCLARCQMDALTLPDGTAALDRERCIGCGLCVTTCPTGALTLERKPEVDQRPAPQDSLAFYAQLSEARRQGRQAGVGAHAAPLAPGPRPAGRRRVAARQAGKGGCHGARWPGGLHALQGDCIRPIFRLCIPTKREFGGVKIG